MASALWVRQCRPVVLGRRFVFEVLNRLAIGSKP